MLNAIFNFSGNRCLNLSYGLSCHDLCFLGNNIPIVQRGIDINSVHINDLAIKRIWLLLSSSI